MSPSLTVLTQMAENRGISVQEMIDKMKEEARGKPGLIALMHSAQKELDTQ